MPGANICVANMMLWVGASRKASKMAIKSHVKNSESFAKAEHPWESQKGRTESDFYHEAYSEGTNIIGDIGYLTPPSQLYSKGVWLENWSGNVKAYGHGPEFGERFQIIEKARDENLAALIARLKFIYSNGGVSFAGITTGRGSE